MNKLLLILLLAGTNLYPMRWLGSIEAPSYETASGYNTGITRRVIVDSAYAYVLDWYNGLSIYSLDAPTEPVLVSRLRITASIDFLFISRG